VVEILLRELPEGFGTIFLKGNHEEMMLDALDGHDPAMWLMNGGTEAVASWECDMQSGNQHDFSGLMSCFRKRLSKEELDFFNNLRLSWRCGDYFFAHAGIDPLLPLDEQDDYSLLWIRDRFLSSHDDFGAVIVHGHTPDDMPYMGENRIGLDTGAVYGGELTAMMLWEGEREIISVN
jgi:serine/threonine protein phosphatase 1